MAFWQAILLGLVEGPTEFIPISSTGHLTIAGKLLGLIDAQHPEQWTAFLAVVQMGPLVAVIGYFFSDILRIVRGLMVSSASVVTRRAASEEDRRNARLGWLVLLSTIPIAVVGLAFRDVIEGSLTKNLWVIAGVVTGLALLLWVAEAVSSRNRDIKMLRWSDALVVGAAQVVSLVPGASRSGTTMTGRLFAGLTRESAARFSFLLSIPAIGASGLLALPKAMKLVSVPLPTLVIATLVAGLSGYASIAFLLRYLQRHSTFVFIWYRLALGVLILGLLVTGIVQN
ncbi:MAG: undecaprenyl-diphosphate phosphatase [Dehalococcoidia bacterium]|nr:undecaprenyl-diphosphate phosphatase [Dehalococcoidia bacterium]